MEKYINKNFFRKSPKYQLVEIWDQLVNDAYAPDEYQHEIAKFSTDDVVMFKQLVMRLRYFNMIDDETYNHYIEQIASL